LETADKEMNMATVYHNNPNMLTPPNPPATGGDSVSGRETGIISREGSYVHFWPAVRLGDALAGREDFRDRPWAEVEPEARRQWEEQHERPWEEFREVVQQAWDHVKAQFLQGPETPRETDSYEAKFLNHFQRTYRDSLYHYDQYAPAYYYGYDLGVDQRLQAKDWTEIEPEARQYWDHESYAGLWEEFREAVYYAWNEARQPEQAERKMMNAEG
jgi:hypothetical protein